jgi:hypothetical protein
MWLIKLADSNPTRPEFWTLEPKQAGGGGTSWTTDEDQALKFYDERSASLLARRYFPSLNVEVFFAKPKAKPLKEVPASVA